MSDPLGKRTYGRSAASPFPKFAFDMEECNCFEHTAIFDSVAG